MFFLVNVPASLPYPFSLIISLVTNCLNLETYDDISFLLHPYIIYHPETMLLCSQLCTVRLLREPPPPFHPHCLIFSLILCDMDNWCGLSAFTLFPLQSILYSDTTAIFWEISDESPLLIEKCLHFSRDTWGMKRNLTFMLAQYYANILREFFIQFIQDFKMILPKTQ